MTTHFKKFPPDLSEIIASTDLSAPSRGSTGIYRSVFKRMLDVSLVMLSLPFTLPILSLLVLILAFRGNPFYFQDRVGRGGKIYRIWKLRTMVYNAEQRLMQHLDANPSDRAEWVATQKLKKDPRITPFGRILRKSSLDELPQLFNVLTGDMSLVGPRPMLAEQKDMYPGTSYYDLRPGITGYWQISDRNETAFFERAFFDTRYNADLSLGTDAKILAATVSVVLRGTGY